MAGMVVGDEEEEDKVGREVHNNPLSVCTARYQ